MTPTDKAKQALEKAEPPKTLRDWVMGPVMKSQLALALPKFFTPERFARIAATQMTKNPKILDCTQASIASCLLDCAQLGIEPDGRKAHLIPYGNTCTLIIDYKGLVALARRSGEIADIHADIVCANDRFKCSFGTNGTLEHEPNYEDRGPVTKVYSFAKLKDGSCSYEVMSIQEIEAIRNRSKAKGSGPWITDWNEMAKKTVFRRHSKWLPVSSEFQEAIDKDYDVPIDITPLKVNGVAPAPEPVKQGELSDEEKAEILAADRELKNRKSAVKVERDPGVEG